MSEPIIPLITATLAGLALGLLLIPLAARLAHRPLPRPVVLVLTAPGLWLRHGLTPSLAGPARAAGSGPGRGGSGGRGPAHRPPLAETTDRW